MYAYKIQRYELVSMRAEWTNMFGSNAVRPIEKTSPSDQIEATKTYLKDTKYKHTEESGKFKTGFSNANNPPSPLPHFVVHGNAFDIRKCLDGPKLSFEQLKLSW